MKAVRITFRTIEEDGRPELQRTLVISAAELKQSAFGFPLLPVAAQREAEKFWESMIMMGLVVPEAPK